MKRILRISVLLAFFFGVEKGLGFVRYILIGRQFRLSPELDAFNAANNLPELIFALISGGALSIALIPMLTEYRTRDGRDAAWTLLSRVLNVMFLVTALLSLVVAVFAPQIVAAEIGVAPGFTPEQREMVVDLMRLNLLSTLLFSLSGLAIAGLQSNQHFLLPALAPAAYDIGMLFGVLVLAPESGYQLGPLQLPGYGLGVYGLVYGSILGSLAFFLTLLPGLLRYRFRWTPALDLRDPGLLRVIHIMLPRVLSMLFIQLVFMAQDNLASRMQAGAVSALVYGWLIMQAPQTIIGTAIGTALLPTLSEQIARKEYRAFIQMLARSAAWIIGLTIPAALALGWLVGPLVSLVFNFDARETSLVVWTSRAFLLGLTGHCLLEIAVRSFYAQQNARTPLKSSALMFVLFIGLAIPLSAWIGPAGIALANAVAFTTQALVLLFLLRRQFQRQQLLVDAAPAVPPPAPPTF
jgi:putative peptidoglycan lipid II flippase